MRIYYLSETRLQKETIGRDEAIDYYEKNYDLIASWFLEPGKKYALGTKTDRVCRFCGKSEPDVKFRKIAHAIPELLGNKSIQAYYECDDCNQFFGSTIEDDFGKWSKPMRTMARIRGKSGVPTLKRGGDTGWRIEYEAGGLQIKSYEDDPVFDLCEDAKTITFKLKREPYTPIAVLKAFVKMGLTLMPDAEIKNFKETIKWIRDPNHKRSIISQFPLLYAFQPGPMRNDLIAAFILRRKPSIETLPYAFFVLGYGNEVYQVPLPSRTQDEKINGQQIQLIAFPTPGSPFPDRFNRVGRAVLDLTGTDLVKGQEWPITMGFDEIIKTDLRGK
jgi:hypothetical protein